MQDFAVGIPHAAFDPERVKSMSRVRTAMAAGGACRSLHVEPSLAPTPRHVWSERLWRWGSEQTASHFLQIQDDVLVAPEFWTHLEAMVAAVPDAPICLYTIHEAAPHLAKRDCPWMTTTDWMVGPAYVLPTWMLQEFCDFRADELRDGAVEAITEDTLLGMWCAWTGMRIWHPTVSIVEHDQSLASLYGNADAPHNRASCSWQDTPVPTDWTPRNPLPFPQEGTKVPHFGRRYSFTPYMCAKWIMPSPAYTEWLGNLDRLERDIVTVRAVPTESAHA